MRILNMLFVYIRRFGRKISQKRFLKSFLFKSFSIMLFFLFLHLCITSFLLPSTNDQNDNPTVPPFHELIPSNPFHLFWTMWITDQSTFRGRRLLALESIFIHHPNATVIMLSPTLNDTTLFLPFRLRGYRIYSFNISLQRMLRWGWYVNDETKDFLQHWNQSSSYFYTHLTDYFRTIILYSYGGTYMDMDAIILQPLPEEEFIGFDQTGVGSRCEFCVEVKGVPGLYLAPGFMRFRPRRKVFQYILEHTFNRRVYVQSCFNCVGPVSYTRHIIQHRNENDSELTNLKLLEPYRLYPYMWSETSSLFQTAHQDTSLELADMMKRSYSLHLFGHMSNQFNIAQGSIVDLLFHQYNLGDLRPRLPNQDQFDNKIRLISPSLYIYTHIKQGRFIGRDVIYLRLNKTLDHQHIRWNITIRVFNGKITIPHRNSLYNLNQAQVNMILSEISYEPFQSTSSDTMTIEVKSENIVVNCSLTILVFSQWVTVLTKTMGTSDRWPVMQRLVASVERYFPQTKIRIASDSGEKINKSALLNFTSFDGIKGIDLMKNVRIHNMREDSGLSYCRNYLVKVTATSFFFLFDDDFELEEDSHLDLLLELIYTHQHIDIIAGKIPEDINIFHDYSGVFLRYNQTLELVHSIPNGHGDRAFFSRSSNQKVNEKNPCRQVDFVPNVFMGRRESVLSVPWDNDLKLGEHEDFFVRFGQANRTVYTCEYVQVHHRQNPWWQRSDNAYYQKRARVFDYYKKMLAKHNCKRIITFGTTNMDLDKLAGNGE